MPLRASGKAVHFRQIIHRFPSWRFRIVNSRPTRTHSLHMNTILAIETSTAHGSVSLFRSGQPLLERHFRSERNHNSHLFPVLQEVLAELGETSLDLIITGTGPGSYNGARIAIAVAQGIGTVKGCPTIGLCSFYGLPSVSGKKSLFLCGDARRQEFYIQKVENGRLIGEVELHSKDVFLTALSDAETIVTLDDPERLAFAGEIPVEIPVASGLISAWQDVPEDEKVRLHSELPEPAYLRPPHITKAKPRKAMASKSE